MKNDLLLLLGLGAVAFLWTKKAPQSFAGSLPPAATTTPLQNINPNNLTPAQIRAGQVAAVDPAVQAAYDAAVAAAQAQIDNTTPISLTAPIADTVNGQAVYRVNVQDPRISDRSKIFVANGVSYVPQNAFVLNPTIVQYGGFAYVEVDPGRDQASTDNFGQPTTYHTAALFERNPVDLKYLYMVAPGTTSTMIPVTRS